MTTASATADRSPEQPTAEVRTPCPKCAARRVKLGCRSDRFRLQCLHCRHTAADAPDILQAIRHWNEQ